MQEGVEVGQLRPADDAGQLDAGAVARRPAAHGAQDAPAAGFRRRGGVALDGPGHEILAAWEWVWPLR